MSFSHTIVPNPKTTTVSAQTMYPLTFSIYVLRAMIDFSPHFPTLNETLRFFITSCVALKMWPKYVCVIEPGVNELGP